MVATSSEARRAQLVMDPASLISRRARVCHAIAQLDASKSSEDATQLFGQVKRIYALGDTK